MVSDNDTAVVRETMATPVAQRRAMTAGRLGHTLPGDRPAAMSLASKRERLERLGLSPAVVMRYPWRTGIFHYCIMQRNVLLFSAGVWRGVQIPTSCPLSHVFTFLQLSEICLHLRLKHTAFMTRCNGCSEDARAPWIAHYHCRDKPNLSKRSRFEARLIAAGLSPGSYFR